MLAFSDNWIWKYALDKSTLDYGDIRNIFNTSIFSATLEQKCELKK